MGKKKSSFLSLCDNCKAAQLKWWADSEGQRPGLCVKCKGVPLMPRRPTFNLASTPWKLIRLAARTQCPDGYPMVIKSQEEWKALAAAWNQGIDSHLEAISTTRSSADHTTGKVLIHPDELHTLLRRFDEAGDEESEGLRRDILRTLGIEEA